MRLFNVMMFLLFVDSCFMASIFLSSVVLYVDIFFVVSCIGVLLLVWMRFVMVEKSFHESSKCDGVMFWEMLDTRFYFVFAHIILYCFLCHIYDFFKSVASHSYVLLLLYAQLVACEVIAVFHFRFLNRTYQRIYRISTECINGVINDHRTIVYLCFLRVRCGKQHRHEKYVVNYSV